MPRQYYQVAVAESEVLDPESAGDQLELTHEFMSMMLAVRRSSVTMTLHTLEGTRAIRGTRGFVTVLDRGRLEEIAGCSYGEAEDEYRRLVGPFGKGKHGLKSVA